MPPEPLKPVREPECPACDIAPASLPAPHRVSIGGPRRTSSRTERSESDRVLLVEDLDALGADLMDVKRRAIRIQATGHRVTWVAVAPRHLTIHSNSALKDRLVSFEDARAVLEELAREEWDHVILASAASGGGVLARWLPRRARWWPTGWSSAPVPEGLTRIAARALGERRLEPLDAAAAWGAAWLLGWAEVDPPASRRPALPLWDGDLVLALTGLPGGSGGPTLEAFAEVAGDFSGVDLVAWSHPTPVLERRARAADIGMRVHHVGPAPRLAESAWLAQASVGILASGPRVSAGLVLRALAAGCPLLWIAPAGRSAVVARWLAEQGCARAVSAERRAIAAELSALLERGPEVERMIERGRRMAMGHDRVALLERLAATIATAPSTRRAA